MTDLVTPADDLLAIPDACRAARICQRSIYNLMNSGGLRAVKIGRRTFIRRSEIERFLRELPAYEPTAA